MIQTVLGGLAWPRLLAIGWGKFSSGAASRQGKMRLPAWTEPARRLGTLIPGRANLSRVIQVRPRGLRSSATLVLASVSNAVVAQSITSAPASLDVIAAVPANEIWAIAAAIIAVCTVAAYVLRGGAGRHGKTLLLATLLTVSALWSNSTSWAQMFAQFTQPAGQTLAIPVVPIVNEGALQGFEPADFLNSAGKALRISALAPPNFNQCFPDFPTSALPPAGGGGPPACAVGYVLGAGSSCRVDVDAICKSLATQATALISVSPTSLVFEANGSATVMVSADPASPQAAQNVMATIPGGSGLLVQSSTCTAPLSAGASCSITFTGSVVEGPTMVTVSGANTAAATLGVTVVASPPISISIAPTSLVFEANGNATVTVSADPASPQAAQNVMATIPGGSGLSVQSSTCTAPLSAGASCSITFTGSMLEGPTMVTVSGANTTVSTLGVTVAASPTISITSPVLANRVINVLSVTGLDLTVANDAPSAVNATAITVTNKAAVPDLMVDDSDCVSVAPGASCTLRLTSNTPYVPSTITVGGTNTANSPTTLIAFSHVGGLVFEISGGTGKVAADAAQSFSSSWTGSFSDVSGASSLDDGAANTAAIIANPACSGAPASCAAQRCQDLGTDWYLPAVNELVGMQAALCAGGSGCKFGGISLGYHWTSTQQSNLSARNVNMLFGVSLLDVKSTIYPVRCVKKF
ncbi:midcut-by-XrtH protein [Ottowia thiooxydans]|uniref:midcut-by-XrtH protein n=1 Tax=Ottowia thiooxydans TaxID=219182 RepID=UPI0012ECAA4E